ncbi:MAG: helix-turn-helix transcriptional regulator [Bdellovibrionales bacterium]|nr:helix-turn-helix transcriptional regulator [Bdellovibrionales bacterium]
MARDTSDLSQKDLAELLGVTSNYISLLENDKREPSVALLREISKYLRVPFGLLVLDSVRPWENAESEPERERQMQIHDLMHQIMDLQR